MSDKELPVFTRVADERIAELQAELAALRELVATKNTWEIRRIEVLEKEQAAQHDGLIELEAELTTIKEKARAAVNAPYEDILDMGLAQALRELEEVLPPQ